MIKVIIYQIQILVLKELKKRFKANEGKTLTLTKIGEPLIRVESSSRVRCWATAKCSYKIGNMEDTLDIITDTDGPPPLEKNFQKFLKLGGNKYKA